MKPSFESAFERRRFFPVEANEVSVWVCRPLESAGFAHAFSSRPGGVSATPRNDLNLSYLSDERVNVDENWRRLLAAIGKPETPVLTLRQTHSDRIVDSDVGHWHSGDEPEGDALAGDPTGVWFAVKTADCLPILIGDPSTGAFAAVHAGWRGTLARIAEKAVLHLVGRYGSDPDHCVAALGPSACAGCYEVGRDVAELFWADRTVAPAMIREAKGRLTLDVPLLNARQLENAGLKPENIHRTAACTMHENDLFFSHRRESGSGQPVGRQAALIGRFE